MSSYIGYNDLSAGNKGFDFYKTIMRSLAVNFSNDEI